jgi:hypothetical protein
VTEIRDLSLDLSTNVPLAGYDNLRANDIVKLLRTLSPLELNAVERRERVGKGRSMVLNRIAKLRASSLTVRGSYPGGDMVAGAGIDNVVSPHPAPNVAELTERSPFAGTEPDGNSGKIFVPPSVWEHGSSFSGPVDPPLAPAASDSGRVPAGELDVPDAASGVALRAVHGWESPAPWTGVSNMFDGANPQQPAVLPYSPDALTAVGSKSRLRRLLGGRWVAIALVGALVVVAIVGAAATAREQGLSRSLSASRGALATTRGTLADTNASLASTIKSLASAKSSLADSNANLATTTQQLGQVQATLATTQQQLTQAQQDLSATKSSLDFQTQHGANCQTAAALAQQVNAVDVDVISTVPSAITAVEISDAGALESLTAQLHSDNDQLSNLLPQMQSALAACSGQTSGPLA